MDLPALLATYQLRQREHLLRITRAMTSRLDLPSLLRLILASAADMVGCQAGLIGLREDSTVPPISPGTAQFHVRAVYGIPPHLLSSFRPLLDDITIVEIEPETDGDIDVPPDAVGEWLIPDLQSRAQAVEATLDLTLGQVVGLLLLFEDELLGVIYLFRGKNAFTPLDRQLLRGFADQAAIAVRNARLYEQRETERSRLATLIENSADGIMILTPGRRTLNINHALAAMLGIPPERAIGKLCHQVLDLQNVTGADFCQPDGPELLSTSGPMRCEGELVRPGGSPLAVAVTYTPLRDSNGSLMNVLVNVTDITRFREEEEMKSTFVSVISHELKTPVALIKGYAQTLARPDAHWDAETARQSLQIIEEEADRLEALINNLLDVSRIQASGLRLDMSDVDLQQLATKVADAYRTQTDHHTIDLDFPKKLPLVMGDGERLRQVLTNLVGNAIKYSPQGGVIRIGGWREDPSADHPGRRVVIYVADQGIGIPEDELAHIFDRFYRVDSGLRRTTAGAGIGLFLARAIIDAHGGQLWVHSELGKGSTFFFALPEEA